MLAACNCKTNASTHPVKAVHPPLTPTRIGTRMRKIKMSRRARVMRATTHLELKLRLQTTRTSLLCSHCRQRQKTTSLRIQARNRKSRRKVKKRQRSRRRMVLSFSVKEMVTTRIKSQTSSGMMKRMAKATLTWTSLLTSGPS